MKKNLYLQSTTSTNQNTYQSINYSKTFILGIDIASRNTGICILEEDKELFWCDEIKLKPIFRYKNDIDYFNHLRDEFYKKILVFREQLQGNCIVVMEHNVRNETLTKVLGMWLSLLSELEPLHLEYVETSTWYLKLNLGTNKDKRETRKEKAKELFYNNNPDIIWEVSEDIADSYCIGLSWFEKGNNGKR